MGAIKEQKWENKRLKGIHVFPVGTSLFFPTCTFFTREGSAISAPFSWRSGNRTTERKEKFERSFDLNRRQIEEQVSL